LGSLERIARGRQLRKQRCKLQRKQPGRGQRVELRRRALKVIKELRFQ